MVAWSFSVLDSFETCAYRHWATKVAKVVTEKQSDEMAWGNRVHQSLDKRIATRVPLPAGMTQWEPLAGQLERAAYAPGARVFTEQRMALNAGYKPVTFFAKDTWVRAITDITIINGAKAFVGDYKTGNPKPNSAQLRLTAAVTFHTYPEVQKINNAFIWLKTGKTETEVFRRDELAKIWQEFMPRVQRLDAAVADNKWPKKPSGLCKAWCPVPKSMCEYRG